ncbi:MAG: sensor histidine kinase [Puniceicoccales bacterium]
MLTFALFVLLLLTIVFYERRWRRARNMIRNLQDSVDSDQKFLIDSDFAFTSSLGLDRLLRSVQEMMEERSLVRATNATQMEQINTTFRNMREGVLLIDNENRIVVSNPSANRLLNEGKSLVDKRVERFIHHPVFLDFVYEVRDTGIYGRRQIRVDLLGKTAWLEISGAGLDLPGSNEGERLSLFLINDISRLKKLEAIRKDFAANVSHELRTPITIIKGFAETLHENGDQLSDEQRKSFTEKVHRNAGRLHALVEDLLSLSRLESRSLELKKERCLLRDAIKAFLDDFGEDRGVPISLSLPDEPVEVEIDRLFFARILSNLVENALKHGKTLTKIEIEVRYDSQHDLVEMIVADDGTGIPEPARDRIFQRFYRVDIGHSRQTGGTGLGLSIVRHAMLAHGGNVRVESRKPNGTRFICVFPAAVREEEK